MKKILLIAFLVLCMTGIYLYFTKQICEFEGKRRLCPKDICSLCEKGEECSVSTIYPPILHCFPKNTETKNKAIDNTYFESKSVSNTDNLKVIKEEHYCTLPPNPSEIGRDEYPIAEEYKHLFFLGQIFTAENCGEERLNQIFGVEDGNYSMGSRIFLKNKPTVNLLKTLEKIGFVCSNESESDDCLNWELWNTVGIKDLMKLEKYANDFQYDDCTNCG